MTERERTFSNQRVPIPARGDRHVKIKLYRTNSMRRVSFNSFVRN